MEESQILAETLGGTVPDFSVWGMFWEAGIVVQLVILLLVLASVWTWAIIFEKLMRIRKVNSEADAFEENFWSGNSLENLYAETKKNPTHPLALVFISAMREWQRSLTAEGRVLDKLSLQERIAKVMRVTTQREMERLEERTVFLATVGSTAPFVGLFGTVWGIMNAFQSIALTSNTSLAVGKSVV